jgi:hypothetical protein
MATQTLGRVVKDPSDVRIYGIDWSAFLAARSDTTISSSSYTVTTGLTKDTETLSGAEAKVKVSGGTAGEDYLATNTVILANGETVQRSFTVAVRDR